MQVANRTGFGPVQAQIGVEDLRRAGLEALGEAMRLLRLAPPHLVFGHTHSAGQLPADDGLEWRTPAGTQLHNSGCWVFETFFMDGPPRPASPYWPGGAIALDDDGPPRLERLLGDLSARELSPAGRA